MANPQGKNQALPKLDSPLTDPDTGGPSLPWYQLLVWVWRCLGQGTANPTTTVNAAQSTTPGKLDVFDSKGNRLGSITLGP